MSHCDTPTIFYGISTGLLSQVIVDSLKIVITKNYSKLLSSFTSVSDQSGTTTVAKFDCYEFNRTLIFHARTNHRRICPDIISRKYKTIPLWYFPYSFFGKLTVTEEGSLSILYDGLINRFTVHGFEN